MPKALTEEEKFNRLKKIGVSVKIVAKNARSMQTFTVNKCGCSHTFKKLENVFLNAEKNNGTFRCPNCDSKNKVSKYSIKEIRKVVKSANKSFVLLSAKGFKTARHSKISVLHETCGESFEITISNLKIGRGCPTCAQNAKTSKAASYLRDLFISQNIDFKEEYKGFKNPLTGKDLPVDFYIPSLKLFIEIDGAQHYRIVEVFGGKKAFESSVFRDYIKETEIKAFGGELIRVPLIDLDTLKDLSFTKQKAKIFSLFKHILLLLKKNQKVDNCINTNSTKAA